MNIINSNDYNRGHEDGYNDGLNKINKRFFKSGLSLKFAIHGSKAIDTYNKGYNAGYEKGCCDRLSKKNPQTVEIKVPNQETIKTNYSQVNNNSNSISMATIQQYELQRDKLVELTQFLNTFKEDINQRMREYQQMLQQMYETGLPENVVKNFEMIHIPETNHLVMNINQVIDEKSIPLAMQNIELMENLIALNS